jgi:hypothetical protein
MTSNQLLTAAAVALAVYAVVVLNRKPGGMQASNAGQNARDVGLQQWNSTVEWNWRSVSQALSQSQNSLTGGLLGA